MDFRKWANQNSATVTVGAVVVLLLSLAFIIMSVRPARYRPKIVDVYYYDMGTGDLFTAKSNEIPPLTAPSGKQGVRAYVFACGDCGDTANRFVGWLELYTTEAKNILTSPPSDPGATDTFDIMERGHLVAGPDGKTWVPANGEQGFRIMEAIQSKCTGGAQPMPCYPGR